jgi:nicotine blue oxidoreductase
MGKPKALVDDWLVRSVTALREGGCEEVTVVLGAEAGAALALLEQGLDRTAGLAAVVAEDWRTGQSASLRAGLAALTYSHAEATLVHLVDLPDVGADVVRRVLDTTAGSGGSAGLARAAYHGVPGHPVLLGRDHWVPLAAGLEGDRGARDYLREREVTLVECGDLATGRDVDEHA